MRLSEAIREGAKAAAYQIKNMKYDNLGGYCAMGAAFKGAGSVECAFAWYKLPLQDCHVCHAPGDTLPGYRGYGLVENVVHLNNSHDWTFAQIADYVESIELAQEPAIKRAEEILQAAAEDTKIPTPVFA